MQQSDLTILWLKPSEKQRKNPTRYSSAKIQQLEFALLRLCLGAVKINHIIRSSPSPVGSDVHKESLVLDNRIRLELSRVLNIQLSDLEWMQTTLPIRLGGLGFRKICSVSAAGYVGARVQVHNLLDVLLANAKDRDFIVPGAYETFTRLSERCGRVDFDVAKCSQKDLCALVHREEARVWKLAAMENACSFGYSVKCREERRVGLVTRPHAGSWLHAYPSNAFSLGMQSDVFVSAVKYWLGHKLFSTGTPSGCLCCQSVDCFGDFSQSCRFFGLRIKRHNLVRDALASLGRKAKLSPRMEVLVDGRKAADVLFCGFDPNTNRDLAIDVTVRNPFRMGGDILVAEAAEIAKVNQSAEHCTMAGVAFRAFGLDTWGGWGPSAFSLVSYLALRTSANENLARSWLVSNFSKFISVALMTGVGECLLHHIRCAESCGRGRGLGLSSGVG